MLNLAKQMGLSSWHVPMLKKTCTVAVHFLADLCTLVDDNDPGIICSKVVTKGFRYAQAIPRLERLDLWPMTAPCVISPVMTGISCAVPM